MCTYWNPEQKTLWNQWANYCLFHPIDCAFWPCCGIAKINHQEIQMVWKYQNQNDAKPNPYWRLHCFQKWILQGLHWIMNHNLGASKCESVFVSTDVSLFQISCHRMYNVFYKWSFMVRNIFDEYFATPPKVC